MEEINWSGIIVQALMFWAVYKLGQISIIHKIGKDLAEAIEKRGLKIERDDDGNISISKEPTPLKIERVESQYFAYTMSGEFLAQGSDFRGLFENIKNRYPNQNFRLDKYQADLTEEETGKLVKSIFDVFGDGEKKDGERRQ